MVEVILGEPTLKGFAMYLQMEWVAKVMESRCVKASNVIYGDVNRSQTDDCLIGYLNAQSKTDKIMKGMLTGPVTILNWSFVEMILKEVRYLNRLL